MHSQSPGDPKAGSLAGHLGVLGGFLLLAVGWTWPVARHISWRVPHDPGDPVLNTWILWWNTQAVPFTSAWWSPPVFYPMPGAFALSEHLVGVALLTTPLQWLGVDVLAAYNVAFILSFVLSGYFAYLLVRYLLLARSVPVPVATAAALVAGVAFGFAPYRASQLSHMQVLQSQWMPLALLAMHAYVDGGRRAWLGVLAVAWLLQALSNGYYLLFFPVLLALWAVCFVDWRRAPQRGLHLAATGAAASLLLLPALVEYRNVQTGLGVTRTLGEMIMFSGDAGALTRRSHLLAYWPDLTSRNQETFLYPGMAILALAVFGTAATLLRRRAAEIGPAGRRRVDPLIFYVSAAVLMWWLAFGPAPEDAGVAAIGYPYTVLTWLPGFSGLRVPARMVMLGSLCLAVAAGLAFARLAPVRRVPLALMAAAVLAAFTMDAWPRAIPLSPPPARVLLPEVPGAAVLELPVDDDRTSTAAMYRAMFHGRPLINGYSGYTPPHYRILAHSLRSGDSSVITELARRQPLIIVINSDRDRDGEFLELVQSMPRIEMVGATNLGPVFVLPKQPAARIPAVGGALAFTTRPDGRNGAVLDLGRVQAVRMLEFPLRGRHRELGSRFEIEGSTDGQTWTSLWLDWTGGLALAGALDDPLDVPVRFVLPDAPVRYLRIHPTGDWMLRDLRVREEAAIVTDR